MNNIHGLIFCNINTVALFSDKDKNYETERATFKNEGNRES